MHFDRFGFFNVFQSPYRAEAQNKSAGRKSAPNKGDLKAATAASDKKFKLVLSNGKVIR